MKTFKIKGFVDNYRGVEFYTPLRNLTTGTSLEPELILGLIFPQQGRLESKRERMYGIIETLC